ncbi:alpha/beta fold hydrolase [Nonomuraea sp. NPDC050556]|uniref:alpha/beta fold hydrolase n=1 Tax=Nonomuraea sp. NPDC050556 TaxID=3364369 RepID=UPI0037AE9343
MRLYCREFDGPADRTLLVIHGGPDWDHSYLVDPLDQLAGAHRLLFPDLRGCGRSPAEEPLTPDAMVADLAELIGEGPVDVLGFSYGGLIAQRLAIQHPALVRRLIVASSSVLPVPDDAFEGWEEYERRRALYPSVWDAPGLEGVALTRAEAFACAPCEVWRPSSLPRYLEILEKVRFTASYLGVYRAGKFPSARYPDGPERLEATGIPVLLLQGRQDMTFPAFLAERVPFAESVILENAGHMAHVDQRTDWLRAVQKFLE